MWRDGNNFAHHCQAFPPSFLVQNCCHWCGVLRENSSLGFAGWMGPRLGSPCGLVSVMWQSCVALPWHWQLALRALLKLFVLGEALPEWQRHLSALGNSFGPWAEFSTYLKRQGTINWQNKLLNVCKGTADTPTSVISSG